jgi:endosialidase-like protein
VNRVEFDGAGIRLYRGSTVVGNWNTADASMLVTGTFQSGITGERIVIFPDGTIRFYPQSGTNYSQMSNVGSDVVWRGPMDANGRSGRVNVNALGVGLNYSAESEIPNRLRAEIAVFDRRTRITSPFQGLEVDGRQDNPAGGIPRIQFSQLSTSGTALPFSFLSYSAASSSGRGGFWGNGAGIKMEAGQVLVTGDELNGFGVIKASEFAVASSARVKRNVVDVEDDSVPLDAEQVFRDVPAVSFNYRDDPADTPPRLGVIAEQLPPILRHMGSDGKGGAVLSTGVNAQLGLHHAAIRRLIARVDALEGRQ